MKIDNSQQAQQLPSLHTDDNIEGKLAQVQNAPAVLPTASSSTSAAYMEQASNSSHLSKAILANDLNLLDKAVLEPLLQTTNADERKATLRALKEQLASTKEALHPRQGVMPLLLKSSDAELKGIGVQAMSQFMQTGKVKLASLRSPAYRTPVELREAASHQWINQVKDLIKKSKNTLAYHDFYNIHNDANELDFVKAFSYNMLVDIRPDLHEKQLEPVVEFTLFKLTSAQGDSFATANKAALDKIIHLPSMSNAELRQALIKEGFTLKVVAGFDSHSQFVNIAKSFEKGYQSFAQDIQADAKRVPVKATDAEIAKELASKKIEMRSKYTKEEITKNIKDTKIAVRVFKRCISIAGDELHPNHAYAKKYLAVAAKNDLLFKAFTDMQKLPLDLTGLVLLKQLSSALDSKEVASPYARPFEQSYKQVLSIMPNDDLIGYAKNPGEHQDFKPDFVKQLADNMNKGTFAIMQGSAAGKALELGQQFPELKEPSLTFVKGRLEAFAFAKQPNLQPAQMFAQQAGHPLQGFALDLIQRAQSSAPKAS
ncbi:MAG TPA: hypothetical protein DHW71_04745 [Gammaproteobacteria bacterium]|nr:hypothetical protein [Gammaproteobacteria bacterium]HBF09458.1 hypothetical protein [Gammaproteobacteria bacterium]HCK92270.1 hypothetical protein [Gammaproteobacteria bacterium]|tara:strand:- start:1281 stop:2906 length:1626 start_codon:yes stop_codon:yes gene_type:complete